MRKQFSPDELEGLYDAFDIAWASVENRTSSANRDAVRDSIGCAIMGLADVGHRDLDQLANYGAYQGRSFLDLRT